MRNAARLYGFYAELQKIHIENAPDLRFGQFISCIFSFITSKGVDPFYLEENEFMQYVHEFIKG